MRLVDSHCHLQADRFTDDVNRVIDAARAAGVERILVPGWDLDSSRAALDLVDRFPWLQATAGVHPHQAADADDGAWRAVAAMAEDPRVVAIGETGLDFDRLFSPREAQLANLRRNLALARESGKPVILHCRSAPGERDAQDTLLAQVDAAGVPGGSRPPGIVHSFSGPLDYGRAMIERGFAISFSGLVFRRGEESSAGVARLVPADRLLVETDSPYLAPPGAPRRRNEPEWVRITARWLAEQRGETEAMLGERLIASYVAAFDGQITRD